MNIYIDKLITNLPDENYGTINLILDGGAFSGSYILGSLYYLKSLESCGKIEVDKMSGCSIGSILCILYKLNDLDYCCEVYSKIRNYFKENGNLYIINEVMNDLRKKMKDDFYLSCNDNIYLSYHDIEKNTCIVKSVYENNEDIIETMIKSSYIPYICGDTALYKDKYADGLKPYIFKNGKALFINLCMDYKCIIGMLNIKDEINNIERILTGILDIHDFFIKKRPSSMCYYIHEMNISQKILHILRLIITHIIIFISYVGYHTYQLFEIEIHYPKYSNLLNQTNYYLKQIIYTYIRYFMV
jgi:hypothetical protein